MLEKFKFDLQLFNEGESADTVEQPETDSDLGNADFAIDEDGNVVFFDEGAFGSHLDGEGEEETEEVAPQEVQPTEPETFVVTVNGQQTEVTLDELLHGYMRQADYSRKTQELAQRRREFESMQVSQPQVQPQYQPPSEPQQQPNPINSQKEYYENLAKYAQEEVEKVFGESYDEYNPMHTAAFSDSVAKINAQIYEMQVQERQRAEQDAQFNNAMARFTQDPNFNAINNLALEKLNSLPYSQAVQIQEALARKDVNIISQYMTAVANEFYGVNNVPTIARKQVQQPQTKPPFVENGGVSKSQNIETKQFDFRNLGKMTTDQQAQLIRQLGFTD